MSRTRPTVSPWKNGRFHAVHLGLDLVAVCVYPKGAQRVAHLLDALSAIAHRLDGQQWDADALDEIAGRCTDAGFRIRDVNDIDHGAHTCPGCGAPSSDPDEDYCEDCAALDQSDLRALIEERIRDAESRSAPVDALPEYPVQDNYPERVIYSRHRR